MYFQTEGEISIEFDLEDVLFIETKNWYDAQEEEINKIQDINNSNHREFLERVHLDQVTHKINLK